MKERVLVVCNSDNPAFPCTDVVSTEEGLDTAVMVFLESFGIPNTCSDVTKIADDIQEFGHAEFSGYIFQQISVNK